MNTKIAAIQGILGVQQDGLWGPMSQRAFDELTRPDALLHAGKASSFADPKDVEVFRKYYAKYKAQGMSDKAAFDAALKKGDNGEGIWGDDTTGATPACALAEEDIVKRWGTLNAGRNKLVQVDANGTRVICVLRDVKGHMNEAVVDLNPGACAALGLEPPIMVSCIWKWA
jgi:hypothetical protein